MRQLVGFVVAIALVVGAVASPRPVLAEHGGEHVRSNQFAGECDFDWMAEQHSDVTDVQEGTEHAGFCSVATPNGNVVSIRTEDLQASLASVGAVQFRFSADWMNGDTNDPNACGTQPLAYSITIEEWSGGFGQLLNSHTLDTGTSMRCSTSSVASGVLTVSSSNTQYLKVVGSAAAGIWWANSLFEVTDPDTEFEIPPECEDDPDNFCDELPTWPPEECEPPADLTDVAGMVGLVACEIFGTIGQLFEILGYIASFLAWAVGRILAAIAGIVTGIVDGILGILGDVVGAIGDMLGGLLEFLFVPGPGLADAWEELMELLNTKAPIGWMLQVITFLTAMLTGANLSGPALTTFDFSIFGASVTFSTGGLVAVLEDYRPVLAGLIYLGCAWVIFHRVGSTLRGSEA